VPQRQQRKGLTMKKYVCTLCTWVYDPEIGVPELGIKPNTPFEDLPDDFLCPACLADKSAFAEV